MPSLLALELLQTRQPSGVQTAPKAAPLRLADSRSEARRVGQDGRTLCRCRSPVLEAGARVGDEMIILISQRVHEVLV